ncbi:hypothetical protein CDAR_275791 [Caerostris darwini]|uniref:Uncharacterized protein n=1 Tax=Caerostris darwini TaxID=1538125 RepID=A0AAV4RS98_9ARAC|nr:hypothetical protein CDAR_275791 [Caerostris darwini]
MEVTTKCFKLYNDFKKHLKISKDKFDLLNLFLLCLAVLSALFVVSEVSINIESGNPRRARLPGKQRIRILRRLPRVLSQPPRQSTAGMHTQIELRMQVQRGFRLVQRPRLLIGLRQTRGLSINGE